jgi:hypothetical protein
MAIIYKMGPMISVGSTKAQGSKAKPASQVRATQSNHSKGQSDKKGGQQLVHLEPHRGDPTSSSIISQSQLGGFLHVPPCGLAPSHPGLLAKDYPGKTCETTWSGFDRGVNSRYLILWRGTCPDWLSHLNGDLGSIQILTRHCGAQSQTVSHLVSSRTTSTSKSP